MTTIQGSDIRKVVVACDAGMGSSVMLTSQLQRTLKPYGVTVEHAQVDRVPADADVVLCHSGLLSRARGNLPGKVVVGFQMFMGDPAFARLESAVKEGGPLAD
ncbi:PTS system mannitol-specific IIB component [Nocardiopsis sp. Huas11]|uniref:PTS lactose transporter subunit IIB n=1 Tax=Nocardiopsis sp. Huas11 TaxID=2183912 RepID=UPI000EB17F17|nr:PTS lactose transporter subunit IIB [Nocardiopsis sp. Huas11]RKS05885.1 PTS system mannitol-specific IIB component [Nocardiopsis sp. Huas11]